MQNTILDFKVLKTEKCTPFQAFSQNTVKCNALLEVEVKYQNGKVKKEKYNQISTVDLFSKLMEGIHVNVDNCVVNFSLESYLIDLNLPRGHRIIANSISADNSVFNSAFFQNITFTGDVIFTNTLFLYSLECSFLEIQGELKFTEVKISGNTTIDRSSFSSNISFSRCDFLGGFSIWDTDYKSRFDIYYSHFFSDTQFAETRIEKPFAIVGTVFCKHLIIVRSIFFDTINLFYMETTDDLTFEDSIANSKFIINNCKKHNCDISFEKLSFKNSFFSLNVNLSNLNIKDLDLYGCVFQQNACFKDCVITNSNRESYRIIKHEFLKANNRIDSLYYYGKEMRSYLSEIINSISTTKGLFRKTGKIFKVTPNLFVLSTNWISNRFGQSYIQAFIFSLVSGIIFFSLYLKLGSIETTQNIDFLSSQYFGSLFEFLNPTHKFDFMFKNNEITRLGYTIDVLARIILGYGYFQIGQAFRKFKIW